MKIPEKAPKLETISPDKLKRITELSLLKDVTDLFKKINDDYLYWDTFKYLALPEEVSHELAWVYLRTMRNSQIRRLPLTDINGQNFGYWYPDSVLKILHYIDQHGGGQILVADPSTHAGEKEKYLINSIMEEAIASSQLEGAATTRKKAKEMLRSGRKPTNKAEQMILNNYITIRSIKKMLNEPLSKKLILEIQASMTKNTLETPSAAGRFRKTGEEIHVVDQKDGEILFNPPRADEIEERINILCDYANKSHNDDFVHPVVKAIILHFWLAYIHPFVDGNGRTARAIFYWYMLKNEYWLFEYLSISRIILKAPAQYARAYLYSEIDNTDLTYFLVFNLKTIDLAIKELQIYLTKKQKELKETVRFIRKFPGLNHRQYDVLHHAISHADAIYTIKVHKNIHNTVYQTARNDLIELEKKRFLERKKKGKEFFFIPAKNIHIKLRSLKNR